MPYTAKAIMSRNPACFLLFAFLLLACRPAPNSGSRYPMDQEDMDRELCEAMHLTLKSEKKYIVDLIHEGADVNALCIYTVSESEDILGEIGILLNLKNREYYEVALSPTEYFFYHQDTAMLRICLENGGILDSNQVGMVADIGIWKLLEEKGWNIHHFRQIDDAVTKDTQLVKALLYKGFDINDTPCGYGNTLFGRYALSDDDDTLICEFYRRHGADIFYFPHITEPSLVLAGEDHSNVFVWMMHHGWDMQSGKSIPVSEVLNQLIEESFFRDPYIRVKALVGNPSLAGKWQDKATSPPPVEMAINRRWSQTLAVLLDQGADIDYSGYRYRESGSDYRDAYEQVYENKDTSGLRVLLKHRKDNRRASTLLDQARKDNRKRPDNEQIIAFIRILEGSLPHEW